MKGLVQKVRECEGCRRRRERLERMIRRAREASARIAARARGTDGPPSVTADATVDTSEEAA